MSIQRSAQDNWFSLCVRERANWSCENPAHFITWLNSYLGEEHMEILTERCNDLRVKYSKADKKDISRHYRNEYKRMRKLRDEGQTGRIEFQNYD